MRFNNIIIMMVVFSFFCIVSCKTGFPTTKKGRKEKKEWEAIVKTPTADSAIKDYWVELVDDKWDYFEKYGNSLKAADVPNLKFMHSLYYVIDSNALFNYEKKMKIATLLKLDKMHVLKYAVKNDSILATIYPKLENGKWANDYGYGAPFKPIAKKIFEVYKSGGEVFNINIIAFPSQQKSFRKFVVVFNGKEFISIDSDGNLQPFGPQLLKIKEQVIQIDREMKKKAG